MAEKVNILNIKEIFYEHGKIKFRYSRYLSADGTKWIRHGFMNLTKMVILFRQKIMKIFYFSSKSSLSKRTLNFCLKEFNFSKSIFADTISPFFSDISVPSA